MDIPEIFSSSKAPHIFKGTLTVAMATKNGEKYFQCNKTNTSSSWELALTDEYERE